MICMLASNIWPSLPIIYIRFWMHHYAKAQLASCLALCFLFIPSSSRARTIHAHKMFDPIQMGSYHCLFWLFHHWYFVGTCVTVAIITIALCHDSVRDVHLKEEKKQHSIKQTYTHTHARKHFQIDSLAKLSSEFYLWPYTLEHANENTMHIDIGKSIYGLSNFNWIATIQWDTAFFFISFHSSPRSKSENVSMRKNKNYNKIHRLVNTPSKHLIASNCWNWIRAKLNHYILLV